MRHPYEDLFLKAGEKLQENEFLDVLVSLVNDLRDTLPSKSHSRFYFPGDDIDPAIALPSSLLPEKDIRPAIDEVVVNIESSREGVVEPPILEILYENGSSFVATHSTRRPGYTTTYLDGKRAEHQSADINLFILKLCLSRGGEELLALNTILHGPREIDLSDNALHGLLVDSLSLATYKETYQQFYDLVLPDSDTIYSVELISEPYENTVTLRCQGEIGSQEFPLRFLDYSITVRASVNPDSISGMYYTTRVEAAVEELTENGYNLIDSPIPDESIIELAILRLKELKTEGYIAPTQRG